jgi:hypothetical protein
VITGSRIGEVMRNCSCGMDHSMGDSGECNVPELVADLERTREGIQALIDSGPDGGNFCRFCGCHECHKDDCPAGKLLPADW